MCGNTKIEIDTFFHDCLINGLTNYYNHDTMNEWNNDD